jgi:hypothetical protein
MVGCLCVEVDAVLFEAANKWKNCDWPELLLKC